MPSSKDILDSVRTTGPWRTVRRVQHLKPLSRNPRPAQLRFAREMDALLTPETKATTYAHPGNAGPALRAQELAARRNDGGTGPRELSPADLVWLQRLPRDPKEVTHADATRVAGLAASASMLAPSSRHLVESIWAPIRELHDQRLAKQELELASRPAPRIPESALSALEEALEAEHPDWPASGVRAYAREQLAVAVAERDAELAEARDRAEQRIEQLSSEAAERVALTRDGAA